MFALFLFLQNGVVDVTGTPFSGKFLRVSFQVELEDSCSLNGETSVSRVDHSTDVEAVAATNRRNAAGSNVRCVRLAGAVVS